MRLLHTSDWHLGRTIAGRSRADEHAAVLDEVVAIAREERVDAMLLAGDVYDHRVAAPDADRLLFETLIRLHREGVTTVVIPGNHESAPRWTAIAPLLREAGTHVIGAVAKPDQGGTVEVPSRDGRERALVAGVPFVPERHFVSARAIFERTDWPRDYVKGMGLLLHAMCRDFREDAVNVLMGHLHTDGALLGGGEMEVTVSPQTAVAPESLPASASYVALGHIHRAQTLPRAPAAARYSGSLLQLDFGEREQTKSVSIVEASAGRRVRVRELPLRSGRTLRDVTGTLDELEAVAPTLGDAWLRVTVLTAGPVPGIADRVRELLPNTVRCLQAYPRDSAAPGTAVGALSPHEQFAAFHRRVRGTEPSAELLEAFAEVHDAVAESTE